MAQQQSSRLHRLLTLLDSGSTQATRLAAARQIGDIAKSYPHELTSLLKKVSQYLCSRNWDTRVAAAHAIGFISENVKHLTLKELYSLVEVEVVETGIPYSSKEADISWSGFHPSTVSSLSFNSFDINKVLEFGSLLLASGGQEYDVVIENGKNPAERLARQKQNLHRRLGLDIFERFMDVNDMIKDEDLLAQKVYPFENGISHSSYASSSGQNIQQLVSNMVPSFRHPRRLSAREINLLKRKAKLNAKDQTKNWSEEDELECSNSQVKGAYPVPDVHKVFMDTAADVESTEGSEKGKWPFCQFVEELIHDMFDPIWETRHGAIMALREILTRQGASVGVHIPDSAMDKSWLDAEDIKSVNLMKRTRDIDLNSQFIGEGGEPLPKRKKTENEQHFSPSLFEDVKTSEMLFDSTVVSGGTGETCTAANVKSDPESSMSNFTVELKEEHDHPLQWESLEYGISTSLKAGLVDLPEISKLRSLLKIAQHSSIKNWEFLQDCAIRCLCILSLDRFGDFVSDQVVAPVRETCAQALGAVLKFMHPSLVHDTLNVLVQMQCRQEWEVRHGGLLGVKYLVAVRQDMIQDLLPSVLPACKAGLEDADDDVRAVAAEALIPAVRALVSLQNRTTLLSIVTLLWDILLDLDDLSPSTSSVMNLLAEIHTQPEMVPKILLIWTSVETKGFDLNETSHHEEFQTKNDENPYILSTLTTRLWPFMRHNIASVRHSAIRTLERLLEVQHKESSSLAVGSIWNPSILCDTLRIVFQNLLLESDEIILQCSERVWRLLVQCCRKDLEVAATSFFPSWVQLATTPVGSALDTSKMFFPAVLPRKSHFKAAAKMRAVKIENDSHGNTFSSFSSEGIERSDDVTNTSTKIVVGTDGEKSVTKMRVVTATALGIFISKLPETSLQFVVDLLLKNLTSYSGFQRQVATMILIAWFKELKSVESSKHLATIEVVDLIKKWLLELLTCTDPAFPTKDSPLPYAELSRTYTKMRNEASVLCRVVDSCEISKNVIIDMNVNLETLGADDAIEFASRISLPAEQFDGVPKTRRHIPEDVESAKQQLLSTAGYLKCLQNNLHVTISSLIASAIVWMSQLPPRLNPIILPLMAAIKREKEEILQDKAAEALAELIYYCIGRKPSPNDKLVKNICCLTCTDSSETPQAATITSVDVIEDQDLLSLGSSISSQKTKGHVSATNADRTTLEGFISRRGSELALMYLCQKFGSSLFDKVPKLWECLTEFLRSTSAEGQAAVDEQQISLMIVNSKVPQALINNIQIVRSVSSMVDETLKPKMLSLLPSIYCCARHCHVAVRLAAARCITSMAKTMTTDVIMSVIEKAIPMLRESTSFHARQGASMLLSLLVQSLGVELVPYAPILVVPLLRCMSDSDLTIRKSVTHSFAALVPLLPLSRSVHLPVKISECLSKNFDDVKFLEQLLDNSHIEDYNLSIKLKVELRRYQQEGINWLSFLRRFNLHGILCDDMGLGKTLQASAMMASDIVENRVASNETDTLSLIICPSTLVAHWAYEIERYIDHTIMITLQYVGTLQERILLRRNFDKHNVIITSYDVVRKDIDFLGKLFWNYCVLDEGHIIRNPKSKVSGAVKQLKAEHRLILSGTPIQNNVLELWSLFDFLMPGFLGTERQFQATYGKPLLAAKDSKCSTKDAEAGVLAMEALHKQIMPFLLRRTKDEVLSDLPEKIIQDRYCDLSPVQLKLYEQFSSSDAQKEISELVSVNETGGTEEAAVPSRATSHVFQALQYLLKLCSHPLLVLGEKPPESLVKLVSGAIPGCSDIVAELHNLQHSPKLIALREILEECGIGLEAASIGNDASVGQHRVLIFAQHRSLLDIIEKDLFQTHMKSVTYLRLDGSVEPDKRFELVKTFNSDPTIDVLLLTTHVGGLGLNLTSADTLIFLEHDWNPMKDHQAMDRAHRLGQRRVVSVHRLIMRGTLEEKVMSLQKFKVSVANAIINAENASLKTMNTDQLLDLFTPAQTTRKQVTSVSSADGPPEGSEPVARAGKGLKAVLSGLEELWDQSQYAEEYNLNQFLAKLSG